MNHPQPRQARSGSAAAAGRLVGAAMALLLCGCEGVQSALQPSGETARELAAFWWFLLWALSAAFVVVVAALVYALYRTPGPNTRVQPGHIIIGGGVIFPGITILVLFFASLQLPWLTVPRDPEQPALMIIGHKFWWEVHYPNGETGGTPIISANEVRLPVGERVYVDVTTADVIHSFWIPRLGGKIDMIPGQINRISLKAEESGVFRGQCYEFCGAQHANMAFSVVAMPPDEFAAWLANEAKPAAIPEDPLLQQGQRAFVSAGCGSCHRIRGTMSDGIIAPDLTHIAGRLTLAAGMFDNVPGNMAGWIAAAQQLKPGNHMPSFNGLDGPSLHALTAYLASLE